MPNQWYQQMKALESWWRTALRDRETKRPQTTRDGPLLKQSVTEMFDILEARLSRLRGPTSCAVCFAVQPSVAESWFVPRLGNMQAAVAPTGLHLTTFDSEPELADIDHDMSVCFGDGPSPRLYSEPLDTEPVFPSLLVSSPTSSA
ncbi:LysR family transcriptional regulator [Streptomyces reniochalinae]|nr:hypothetical protein [Streptomyces reniochalinae]